jgi:hypothetical protein
MCVCVCFLCFCFINQCNAQYSHIFECLFKLSIWVHSLTDFQGRYLTLDVSISSVNIFFLLFIIHKYIHILICVNMLVTCACYLLSWMSVHWQKWWRSYSRITRSGASIWVERVAFGESYVLIIWKDIHTVVLQTRSYLFSYYIWVNDKIDFKLVLLFSLYILCCNVKQSYGLLCLVTIFNFNFDFLLTACLNSFFIAFPRTICICQFLVQYISSMYIAGCQQYNKKCSNVNYYTWAFIF